MRLENKLVVQIIGPPSVKFAITKAKEIPQISAKVVIEKGKV